MADEFPAILNSGRMIWATVNGSRNVAIDYGIVQLSLDGKKLGAPIDLINNGVVTQVYDLGRCYHEEGEY